MRKLVQRIAGALSLAIIAVQSVALYTQAILPDYYYVAAGETFQLQSALPISALPGKGSLPPDAYTTSGNNYNVSLTLPYGIPIKQVQVQVVDREQVIPGGNAFGIKMFTEGVIVVGMSDVTSSGNTRNPAKAAGIRVGDILLSINGKQVQTNEDVGRIVSSCGGKPVVIEYLRANEEQKVSFTPAKSEDGVYRAGVWVRDSSAGIGTMTYYDPSQNLFAGLGHAICDIDTGDIMPLHSGEIVDVSITGIQRGASGSPGELRGNFTGSTTGELRVNSPEGIFGYGGVPNLDAAPVPMALRYEVQEGPATIRCTLDGGSPKEYSVLIERVSVAQDHPTKNMVLRVTDPALLALTGGIVQGMSGSPILQNGKLAGAVTHVFVNDPTRGYGIFAENMAQSSKSCAG